jgi:hypothetical protein
MTGKQVTVMWLGLLLVAVQFFTGGQWSALWGTVTTADPAGASAPGGSGSSSPSLPKITIPIMGEPVTFPVSKVTAT